MMIQLYFLSIVLNGLSGFLLIGGDAGEGDSIESSLRFLRSSSVFRLILGILTGLTGVLKLLSPLKGNIAILGDLIPALAGIAAGFILLFGYYREQSSAAELGREGKLDQFGDSFLRHKRLAGVFCIASALLHFLLPEALFL